MDRNYYNSNYYKRNILPPTRSTSLYNFNNNNNNNAPNEHRDYYISSIENDYRNNNRYTYFYNNYDFENSNYMASLVEKRSSAPSRTQVNSLVLREKLLNNNKDTLNEWSNHDNDNDYLENSLIVKQSNIDEISNHQNNYNRQNKEINTHLQQKNQQQQQHKRLHSPFGNKNSPQLGDGDKNLNKLKLRNRKLTDLSGIATNTTDEYYDDHYNACNNSVTHRRSISTNLPPTQPPNIVCSTKTFNSQIQATKIPSSPRVLIYKSLSRSPKLHNKINNKIQLNASPISSDLLQDESSKLIKHDKSSSQSYGRNSNTIRTQALQNYDLKEVLQGVASTNARMQNEKRQLNIRNQKPERHNTVHKSIKHCIDNYGNVLYEEELPKCTSHKTKSVEHSDRFGESSSTFYEEEEQSQSNPYKSAISVSTSFDEDYNPAYKVGQPKQYTTQKSKRLQFNDKTEENSNSTYMPSKQKQKNNIVKPKISECSGSIDESKKQIYRQENQKIPKYKAKTSESFDNTNNNVSGSVKKQGKDKQNIKSKEVEPTHADSTDDGSSLEDDDDFEDDFINDENAESSSDSDEGYKRNAYLIQLDNSLSPSPTPDCDNVLKNPDSLLSPSLFPNVPPYLSFSTHFQKGPLVHPDIHRVLKWKQSKVMPKVVRHTLHNSGCRLLTKSNDYMASWGKHLKSLCFRKVRPYQKINHLPGSFCIGRKDSSWKTLKKQMIRHGKKEFGFMPKTYILPHDLKILRKSWPKYAERNVKWIIKPPACARGTGIKVVNMWCQIPKRKPLIVQKYIERPFLINGSKFDIRLYVLVTSVNPLKIYLYNDGLARFASIKYSQRNETLNDRCMHLTNYSINKHSSNYSKNQNVNGCDGHKWTLKSLWTYLDKRGVNTPILWRTIRNLILRTILASENTICNMTKMNVESRYSVFELFGFDILLDSDLIPWLLEVNISPSLHSDLPLDLHVKGPLIQAVLNTALYHVPPKISIDKQKEICASEKLQFPLCYDKRLYITYLSQEEKVKHTLFTRKVLEDRDQYVDAILKDLTPDDIRCLITTEDELARCSPLERIFPTNKTFKFLKFTEHPRYYNRLLDAWEHRYGNDRISGITYLRELCKKKSHLEVPNQPVQRKLKIRTRTMKQANSNSILAKKSSWNISKQRIIKQKRSLTATANLLKILDKNTPSETYKSVDSKENI